MSYRVYIQRGSRLVASASLGEDGRLREFEPVNAVWPLLLRALALAVGREARDEVKAALRTYSPPDTPLDGAGRQWKTHCKHGHALTPDSVYVTTRNGKTYRNCRECVLLDGRRRYRMRVLTRWHGPCPSCGQTHNPDEVSEACVDAIAEALQPQSVRRSRPKTAPGEAA